MKIAVIGGGAAGFFSAISVKEHHSNATVIIFEKSRKVLAKVKVSGGGKCNVTNACPSIRELSEAFPRGQNFLKKSFRVFNNRDMMDWLEAKGVPLWIRPDNHVFPKSRNSQTIIDCFTDEIKKLGIHIEMGTQVNAIIPTAKGIQLKFSGDDHHSQDFDKVIVATGGHPKKSGFEWLEALGHKIEDPVPSLFTFNMPGESITKLMGVAVETAIVNIQGTKLKSSGPLLITHWGMSGPAILKLSAFGARTLANKKYNFKIQVNWVNVQNQELVLSHLNSIKQDHPKKNLSNIKPYDLPERLWLYFLTKCDLPDDKKWGELSKKGLNKLVTSLSNDVYSISGKTTFKEEFVTCGGVSLNEIDVKTMESKVCPNLFFTGEVMDIDGITGGYNFQSAWTTAFIAGQLGGS